MMMTLISNSNNINNSKNKHILTTKHHTATTRCRFHHGTICATSQRRTSNLANVQVHPRKPVAELLDAPVHKQILWDAAAAVGKLGQTPAIKQVVQPDFVVEPAAHLIVGDKSRGLGT